MDPLTQEQREALMNEITTALGVGDLSIAVIRRAAFSVINDDSPERVAALLRMAAEQLRDVVAGCEGIAKTIAPGATPTTNPETVPDGEVTH